MAQAHKPAAQAEARQQWRNRRNSRHSNKFTYVVPAAAHAAAAGSVAQGQGRECSNGKHPLHFPPELVDRSIDYLHDDRYTLATCALVSNTWTPASRYHVFGHVNLSDESWREYLRLLTSPFATFAPHSTHTLTFATTRRSNGTLASLLNDIVPKLPQFPAVNSLYLGSFDLEEISPHTVTSLAALFGNITVLDIRHIFVRDFHEFARVVSLFTRLEKMFIRPYFRNDDPQAAPLPDLPRGLVQVALSWHGSSRTRDMLVEILPWLEGTSVQPSPVQNLRFNMIAPAALPALGRLLRVLGSQLQALDVSFSRFVTPAAIDEHIDLSENRHLRDLAVHASSAPWGLISAVRTPIRTITIKLFVEPGTALDNLEWDLLTSLLAVISAT
ncbi:hypothetical protein C8R46DRAFT_1350376 [Mycena filopes]|nr:hypothetical protein C8R46DRAFT_1350376 [Mycena filopes]